MLGGSIQSNMERLKQDDAINLNRAKFSFKRWGTKWGHASRVLGVSEQSYYRWRREYGGLKIDQAKRLRDLAKENVRLQRAVSDLTLEKLILKEALEGNY